MPKRLFKDPQLYPCHASEKAKHVGKHYLISAYKAARIMLVADPTFVEPARLAWERFCRRERRGYLHGIHAPLGRTKNQ